MDDVWKHQVWEDVLQTPLVSAALAHGSRVLITTRHDMVARGMLATKPYHYVNKLNPEDAWLLLKKKVRNSYMKKSLSFSSLIIQLHHTNVR